MKKNILSLLAFGLIVVGCTHGETKKCDSKETTSTTTTAPTTPPTDATAPKEGTGTVMSEPEVMPKETPPEEKAPMKKTKKTKKTKKVEKDSVTQ